MNRRRRVRFGIALATVLGLAARAQAAGTLDHLLCEKAVDKLKIKTAVDMIAEIQPEFTARGCVLVKPVEFCVPATKTNVQPPPALPNVVGQPLKNDYVCYLAKCPTQQLPPDKQVIDQFGARIQRKYKPYKVCVPARKTKIPCGPTGAHMCGGACPDPTQTCSVLPTDGCGCLPVKPPPCGTDPKTGQCGGLCPTNQICVFDPVVGTPDPCHCQDQPPPPCGVNAAGICGGSCPNTTDVCAQPPGAPCACYPPPPTCSLDAAGVCGGTCPNGLVCNQPAGAACGCYPPPTPCGDDPATGQCGGVCPNANEVCVKPPGATACGCFPQAPTCAKDSNGACGGTCPPGEGCFAFGGGLTCDCSPNPPPACNGTQAPACGGTCPAPALCRPDAVAGCSCQ